MEFEIIDHPADIGFRVYGESLEKALENASEALYSLLMMEKGHVCKEEIELEVHSEDLESMLYDFLENILISYEVDNFVACKYNIGVKRNKEKYILSAALSGYHEDPRCENRKYDVKAITYHMMAIENTEDGWLIQVIVDI